MALKFKVYNVLVCDVGVKRCLTLADGMIERSNWKIRGIPYLKPTRVNLSNP